MRGQFFELETGHTLLDGPGDHEVGEQFGVSAARGQFLHCNAEAFFGDVRAVGGLVGDEPAGGAQCPPGRVLEDGPLLDGDDEALVGGTELPEAGVESAAFCVPPVEAGGYAVVAEKFLVARMKDSKAGRSASFSTT